MKILKSEQIRALDQYTIQNEPIASIDLMERASLAFVRQLKQLAILKDLKIVVYCGPGNNGGDGLAIARILHEAGYQVQVIRCQVGSSFSADHVVNWEKLKAKRVIQLYTLKQGDDISSLPTADLIVDAIFGAGLNRPLEGYWAKLITHLNEQPVTRVAVDIPSGLFADKALAQHPALQADHTISFQLPKLSFFASEHHKMLGQWHIVDIGLAAAGVEAQSTPYHWVPSKELAPFLHRRDRFDHKGIFGHALLIAGSFGKLGAATLSAKAILRAGAGLVTVHVPRCGYEILQIAFPEAMISVDKHQHVFTTSPPVEVYKSIGIGPGLGQDMLSAQGFKALLEASEVPLVIDADALNILATHPAFFELLPPGSILTPHPGEFKRLFGAQAHSFDHWETMRQQAQQHQINIILKGGYSVLATPEGELYFFTAGNPGMGTAGAGDVLTGILTGLLAQDYDPSLASKLGITLHGLAGDIAAECDCQESLIAEDIIKRLGAAFRKLSSLE